MEGAVEQNDAAPIAHLDPRIRARAQALLQVMVSGCGNLFGYLSTGVWRKACTAAGQTDWPTFWLGTSAAAGAVFLWFAFSYRGREAK